MGGGGGRQGGQDEAGGNDPLPTPITDFTQKNLTRDKSTDLFDLGSGPVVFTQIKSFGHNDETTQQGAYLSLTQLQYKTVGKRHTKKIVKRAFCVHAQQHTGGIAFLGFL